MLDWKTKRWNDKHWFSFKLFFLLLVLYFLNGKGGKINNKSFWHFSCMNLNLLQTHSVCVLIGETGSTNSQFLTQVLNRFPWRKQLSRRRRKNNFRHSLRHLQSFFLASWGGGFDLLVNETELLPLSWILGTSLENFNAICQHSKKTARWYNRSERFFPT